jgi:Cytochrome c7 and related cytochrome c/Class III cytochrome C family
MRRFLLLAIMFCMTIAARTQNPSKAIPPTMAAPGTQASTGAPTITNPMPAPGQPVAFSHKKHIDEAKMACNNCHEPSRNGSTLAIPQPAKCMLCHTAIATDKPDVKRMADAARNSQVLQWVRVYRLPSFVTFSHKTHTSAGAQCEECHGPVAQRDAIALEKDISMGGCISCHSQKAAPTGCDTCHQLNSTHLRAPSAASDDALVAALTQPHPVSVGNSVLRFLAMLNVPLTASTS